MPNYNNKNTSNFEKYITNYEKNICNYQKNIYIENF